MLVYVYSSLYLFVPKTLAMLINVKEKALSYCVTHYYYVSVWNVTRVFCSVLRGYGGREVMFASPVYRKEM